MNLGELVSILNSKMKSNQKIQILIKINQRGSRKGSVSKNGVRQMTVMFKISFKARSTELELEGSWTKKSQSCSICRCATPTPG